MLANVGETHTKVKVYTIYKVFFSHRNSIQFKVLLSFLHIDRVQSDDNIVTGYVLDIYRRSFVRGRLNRSELVTETLRNVLILAEVHEARGGSISGSGAH